MRMLPVRARAATVPQVVVTDTQITGIAGATIHYSNLADGYEMINESGSLVQVSQFPGLMIRMPTYGIASVQVQNTPGGATTELDTLTNAIGNVTVQATTGALSLGDLSGFATGEFYNFAAASVNIGGGSLLGIKGNVDIGDFVCRAPDDHRRSQRQHRAADDVARPYQHYARGPIDRQHRFSIECANHIRLQYLRCRKRPMDHERCSAEYAVVREYGQPNRRNSRENLGQFPTHHGLGRGSISLDGQTGVSFSSSKNFKVEADPARPTDVTNLTVDLSNTFQDNLSLNAAGGGFFSFFTNNGTVQPITYEGDTTRLTYITDFPALNDRTVSVVDTGSAGTVISAGRIAVNVLGTDGPLEVDQGNGGPATLGNSGSLQGIHGTVTFVATNAAFQPCLLSSMTRPIPPTPRSRFRPTARATRKLAA